MVGVWLTPNEKRLAMEELVTDEDAGRVHVVDTAAGCTIAVVVLVSPNSDSDGDCALDTF